MSNTADDMLKEYLAIKNTVYDLYPVFQKIGEEKRQEIYAKFHTYGKIAEMTFKYPNDLEIYEASKKVDNKELTREEVLSMYNISSQDFEFKCGEYKMFDFGKRIENEELDFRDFSKYKHNI